jgi:hypothetical protein
MCRKSRTPLFLDRFFARAASQNKTVEKYGTSPVGWLSPARLAGAHDGYIAILLAHSTDRSVPIVVLEVRTRATDVTTF